MQTVPSLAKQKDKSISEMRSHLVFLSLVMLACAIIWIATALGVFLLGYAICCIFVGYRISCGYLKKRKKQLSLPEESHDEDYWKAREAALKYIEETNRFGEGTYQIVWQLRKEDRQRMSPERLTELDMEEEYADLDSYYDRLDEQKRQLLEGSHRKQSSYEIWQDERDEDDLKAFEKLLLPLASEQDRQDWKNSPMGKSHGGRNDDCMKDSLPVYVVDRPICMPNLHTWQTVGLILKPGVPKPTGSLRNCILFPYA